MFYSKIRVKKTRCYANPICNRVLSCFNLVPRIDENPIFVGFYRLKINAYGFGKLVNKLI